jgi:disulfide bond formation protein DsbB
MMNSADCPMCKIIRTYLILAVPVLAVLFLQPSEPIFGAFSIIKIAPWFVAIGLPSLIAWKYYHEIYKRKRKSRKDQSSLH